MTRINEYLWQLPHTPLEDDPPDVGLLQQVFNEPIVAALEEPLAALGYHLNSNDIMVHLDAPVEHTRHTYHANVRFIRYLRADVITRIHFEHSEWAHFLPGSDLHHYFINLDRFKVADPTTQVVVPAWPGRLHTRLSRLPGQLQHTGEDQIWSFTSVAELEQQIGLFLEKFTSLAKPWLENLTGL
ncbi:MAG TPA: hypothetical protein ENI95_03210 [Chloroflexi bacterium]|nr:hypothetical protein [Chloroflexota bacterium]